MWVQIGATSQIPSSARLVAAEGSSRSECDVWSLDEPLESEGLSRKLPGTLKLLPAAVPGIIEALPAECSVASRASHNLGL